MKSSKLFSLNLKDLLKGALVAALTVIVAGVSTSLGTGYIPSTKNEWGIIIGSGLSAGVAYLLKNFFSAPPK